MSSTMNALRSLARRPVRRIRSHPIWRKFRAPGNVQDLPNELWAEIFRMLENPGLLAVSRVNRAFNALAIPLYLARNTISQADLHAGMLQVPAYLDILPVLRTAFSLPPIRNLTCNVYGSHRTQLIGFLRRFVAQHPSLQEIHLTFYASLFQSRGRFKAHTPKKICRLLNDMTRNTGRALIIAGNRGLVSGAERGELWRVVRRVGGPPRGIRARIRTVTKRTSRAKDVVLKTAGEIQGLMRRDSYILDVLLSIDITYSSSPDDWTVIALNAGVVDHFSLTPGLSAVDWARVLPSLNFRLLQGFSMGRPTGFGNPELRDVSAADLDAFLARHPRISRLEYVPQLPSASTLGPPTLSLVSLPYLTSLTTTPAHFIHLHSAPNTFPELIELVLFAPPSMPAEFAQRDFAEVLHLLAGSDSGVHSLRMRFPGAWLAPHPTDLRIECLAGILIFGEFALDAPALAEFLAPFEPGLKRIELHPTDGTMFERKRCVEQLQLQLPWLEDVSCSRAESRIQTISLSTKRQTISRKYSD
ncbi:hypothetical protein FB451DRAFT_1288114 [Mycena latifolia]|nr:hypothetical protein FB451DRAFT_1288114 [Mycena latifolia]